MRLSAWFIHRPVATAMLTLGLMFLGISALMQLPIAGVPQVDIPTISVSTSLPGASAETMASAVTSPLERALSVLPGVTSLISSSSLGQSSISVQFDLARGVDAAALDVQTAINAAQGDLPKNLPHPPTFEKRNPSDALLMTIAVYSDTLPIADVDDYVETVITPVLARVQGVGLVDYHGQQKPAVRVQIDPGRIAALGLTLEDVRQRITLATANGPKGTLADGRRSLSLESNDQLSGASEFDALVLTSRNGVPVRIRDVGQVIRGVEDVKQAAWVGQHRAIMIDVHKQVGYNINATVERVKGVLPGIQSGLPAAMHMTLLGDRTQTIRGSVRDVQFTLVLSCLLVVAVVYAFLGNWRATLIPAIAIPLSLLGTLAAMVLFNFTLDNVSLMALTVSVGFVIDDAIVMLENILRHIEEGASPMDAALRGSGEIGFTIVSMTLSLVAVFIPLLFMGGLVGRLFHEFAYTAAIAILISGVVSLVVTPVLCAYFITTDSLRVRDLPHRLAHAGFEWMQRRYERGLHRVLDHPRLMLALMLLTLGITAALFLAVPKGFFPQQDNGLISGVVEAAPDIAFPAMAERMKALVVIVRADPDVENVYYWIEGDPSLNIGRLLIDLKPFGQRSTSVYEVIRRLKKSTAGSSSIALSMQARQDLQIGARVSKTQFQYTLRDPNLSELRVWVPKILAAMREVPEITDVTGDTEPTAPRAFVRIDRDVAARLGVSMQSIDDTLYDAFGQRQIANTYTQVGVYRVVLEVDPRFQLDESALQRIYVPSQSGLPVPLGSLSRIEHVAAPLTVNHDGQFPAVTLSFNLAPGRALGDAVAAIKRMERAQGAPTSLSSAFAGSAQAFEDSLANQPFLIGAALLTIFIVLGVLYESVIHPVTIMSTLPSAGIGGLLALMLLHYDFSLIALIGIILLIGIVKKNGIMMVDVAIHLQAQGTSPRAAIYEASVRRFRPIMMTTMAALLGALPLAFGSGAGSELRRPLGITMVGGLLLSQVLTLYTTPVVYLYMGRVAKYFAQWRRPGTTGKPPRL